jgi:hypothetical protein
LRTCLIKMSSLSKKNVIDLRNKGCERNANNTPSLSVQHARKCARETEWSAAFSHSGQYKSLRFLGKFIKLQKSTSPSVRPLGTTWLPQDGFSWNLVRAFFENLSIKYVWSSVELCKNSGYFKWRPIYIYNNNSLNFLITWNVPDKSCTENQNTHFVFSNLFPKIVPFMR